MGVIAEEVAKLLRPVPDFPKPGILFWDIAPVLREPHVMWGITEEFFQYWKDAKIDVVAGFDARGFIFGPALAARLGASFEQIRKKGKLPGKTQSVSYDLEYGSAEVEMIDDSFIIGKRILLIDDLLATGGTAAAGAQLVEQLGGTVVGFACVTELPELMGRSQLMDYPIQSLVTVIEGNAYHDVEYCVDLLTFDQKTSDLLLINRLNEPQGLAMPGGRIERESLMAAGQRELFEETGSTFQPGFTLFHSVLTNPNRDPRGVKVSYVLLVLADTSNPRAEQGKTEIVKYTRAEGLPDRSLLVLGHDVAVHAIPDTLKHFGLSS